MSTPRLDINLKTRVGSFIMNVSIRTSVRTLVVIGPNGAGKSTLLSLLLGEHKADEGHIQIDDEVLFDSAKKIDIPLEKRRLAYLPQDYSLFPHLTVRRNVEFAIGSALPSLSSKQRAAQADEHLKALGLLELADRLPHTLSGGEQQRVAIARAVSTSPRALLLDEPLSALDVHYRGEIRLFLSDYLERLCIPSVIVTHDVADVKTFGHEVIVLEKGQITQQGTWNELLANPRGHFVRAFIAETSQ